MSGLADFHLLRPAWLLIALPALWLIWRSQAARTAGNQWARACDPALLAAMMQHRGTASRWPRWLASMVTVVLAIALSGPSWQRLPTPVLQSDAATVIVLDLSKSMDATDLQPSRLARARFAALDVLDALPEGRIGVVSFAGTAFTVVPLTDDRETARHLINSLSTDVMPIQGSNIAAGLAQAGALLANTAVTDGRVVLLTDSSPDSAARSQADALREPGHRLQAVGFGTAAGAPVPTADGGWIKHSDGSIVLASLDSGALASLARRGGGGYHTLPAAGLLGIAQQWSESPQSQRRSRDDLTTDRWLDAGQWLVWLLLPLCALGARRGWLAQMVLVCGCLTAALTVPPSHAAEAGLWRNADQQGKALLDAGKAEQAQQAFSSSAWRGVAAFEAGDFNAAAASFAESGQADAQYNRGNALARGGDLQAALEAYDAQLAQQPEHADAKHNRELVQSLLDQQQQQSGEDGEPGDSDGEQDQSPEQQQGQQQGDSQDQQTPPDQDDAQQAQNQTGDPSDQDASNNEPQEQPGQQPDAQQQDQQQQAQSEPQPTDEAPNDPQQDSEMAQAMSEKDRAEQQQQQALEQWLRRVPDDPGGLLRRKFAREQARRNDTQDSEQAW